MVDENATVADILATGFTYQGQLLRRSLVELNQNAATEEAPRAVALPEEPAQTEERVEVPVFADSPAVVQHESTEPASEPTELRKRQRPLDEPGAQNELPLV